MKAGEQIEIIGIREATKTTVATSMEMFRKTLDTVQAGDNAGILLRGVERKDIERGQVLAKPGSIKPHVKFEGEVYILRQGGGWSSHSVLQGIPSSVLLPHDGRDGEPGLAGGG